MSRDNDTVNGTVLNTLTVRSISTDNYCVITLKKL